MPSFRPLRLVAPAACAALLIPAAALAAKPTSQDGAFSASSSNGSHQLSVGVASGKINSVYAILPLAKHGTRCKGMAAADRTSFQLVLKHAVRPSGSGSFSITSTRAKADSKSRARISVSGRFTSATKARMRVKASAKGCTGSYSATTKFGGVG